MKTKLIGCFVLVIAMLVIVIGIQIQSMQRLAMLQDEGAARAEDAVRIGQSVENLRALYAIIADAIINGNIAQSKEDFAAFRKTADEDIRSAEELADTEEEKENAARYAESFREYMGIFEQKMLPVLETREDSAKRFEDAMVIGDVTARVTRLYQIIADAIINRNLQESKNDFAKAKAEAQQDIATVQNLVDTEEEKGEAAAFASAYNSYLDIFEARLITTLETDPDNIAAIRALDREVDKLRDATETPLRRILESLQAESRKAAEDMAKIRELDEEIDTSRDTARDNLMEINVSLGEEMVEADRLFDEVRQRSLFLAVSVSIVAVLIAMAIAFLLTRSITKPVNEAVNTLSSGSDQVSSAARQVAESSQSLAAGASEQAAALEETSASMEEITSMTSQNAENAASADGLMKNTLATIDSVRESMNRMEQSMQDISESSAQTQKIVKTIDEIAFQTNLLALNAAVEAARAGEAGAGFAVVAGEVRSLAMRAAEAAKSTSSLIEDIARRIDTGRELVAVANQSFQAVTEQSGKVGELVAEISIASKEQSEGIKQISAAVVNMEQVTQTNSAAAEESAAASEELSAQAASMLEIVHSLQALVHGAGNGRPSVRAASRADTKNLALPEIT